MVQNYHQYAIVAIQIVVRRSNDLNTEITPTSRAQVRARSQRPSDLAGSLYLWDSKLRDSRLRVRGKLLVRKRDLGRVDNSSEFTPYVCIHALKRLDVDRQYAYAPPDTGQYKAPPLTKTQAAPKYFQRTSQAASSNSTANAGPAPVGTWLQREDSFMQQQATHATGMHQKVQPSASGLPALSKFRPAGTPAQTPRNQAAASASRGVMQRPVMGPPPTPQRLGTRGPTLTSNQQSTGGRPQVIATPGSRRFVPPTVDNTGQRAQQVGPNQVSQGGRPMHGPGQAGSGQRMPFIPGVSK